MGVGARLRALNITLDYEPQNNTEDPAFDPNGTLLTDVLRAAADHWESIILDNHDMTIRFWYEESTEFIASAKTLDSANNRVTLGRIKFDIRDSMNNLRDWWFDPTPEEDSEFDMGVVSYRGGGQFSDFVGAPRGGLEVGYRGPALPGPAPTAG